MNINRTALARVAALITAFALAVSLPANAQYEIEIISAPGAQFTQAFGINNAGIVVGVSDAPTGASFSYNIKSGEYTTIEPGTNFNALEISNSGTIVGAVEDVCAIRSAQGEITLFTGPNTPTDAQCQARGVNPAGMVSGFEVDPATGSWTGFLYDARQGTFETFLPTTAGTNLPTGVDARGQVAGSVFRLPDELFPGSEFGTYGYLRRADGSFKYLVIENAFGNIGTRVRAITESGMIAGWYTEVDDSGLFAIAKAFVTPDTGGTGLEQIALTEDQVLYRSPCDPNVPPAPGPDYVLITDFFAADLRNDGMLVGSCRDTYVDLATFDAVTYTRGWVATPTP